MTTFLPMYDNWTNTKDFNHVPDRILIQSNRGKWYDVIIKFWRRDDRVISRKDFNRLIKKTRNRISLIHREGKLDTRLNGKLIKGWWKVG